MFCWKHEVWIFWCSSQQFTFERTIEKNYLKFDFGLCIQGQDDLTQIVQVYCECNRFLIVSFFEKNSFITE